MIRTFRSLALVAAIALGGAACGDGGGTVESEGTGSVSGTGTGSGSGTGSGTGAPELDLVRAGTLTVCSDIPYAPFEFEEGGEVVGVDADLMRAMAKELDLEATFVDTDFDGIFAALAARKCDVIASSVSITEERKQQARFTDGYFSINQSLLVRKGDESRYSDLPALKGRTIGVQSETTGAEFAKERAADADVTVKEFTGADELFSALKAKQIDGIVQDLPVNAYNAQTSGDTVVAKIFDTTEQEEYGFVVAKDAEALQEALDGALESVRESGGYDQILKKYLGDLPQVGSGSGSGSSGSSTSTTSR